METNIKSVIQSGENLKTAFESSAENNRLIAEILCSFANSEGGSLFIGIRKNGKVAGAEPSESYSLITDSIEKYCNPSIDFDSNIYQEGHKIILEIIVQKSNKIHKISEENGKWVSFIRIKNKSVATNSVLNNYLKLKNSTTEISSAFSPEEEKLIAIFDNTPFLSLTQIMKKIEIKKEKIEYLLAKLIIQKVLFFNLYEDVIVYSLNKQ
jgi:predicted HTH transcriptional regulator